MSIPKDYMLSIVFLTVLLCNVSNGYTKSCNKSINHFFDTIYQERSVSQTSFSNTPNKNLEQILIDGDSLNYGQEALVQYLDNILQKSQRFYTSDPIYLNGHSTLNHQTLTVNISYIERNKKINPSISDIFNKLIYGIFQGLGNRIDIDKDITSIVIRVDKVINPRLAKRLGDIGFSSQIDGFDTNYILTIKL